VVAAFQIGKVPPALPLFRTELGFTLFLAGCVLSAFNIVGAVTSSAAGAISDWLGHRRLILLGLSCQALGSFMGAFAQNGTFLFFTRFLEGLGYIVVAVSAPALIIRVTGRGELRMAFGVWSSFMPTGTALMMIAAPHLINSFGWRGMWLINAGLLLAFAIWLGSATRDLGNLKRQNGKQLKRLPEDIWRAVKTPGLRLLTLCFASYAFQFLAVIGFLPTLLIEEQSMTPVAASLLSAIVVNAPSNLLGGWLLQRGVKRWKLIALTNAVMGLCYFGIYNSGLPLYVRYCLCLTFCGIGGFIPSAAIHGAAVFSPSRELISTSNGLLMQGAQLGLLAGPPLLAAAVSHTGNWSVAPWVLVIPATAGILLSIALRNLARRDIRSDTA